MKYIYRMFFLFFKDIGKGLKTTLQAMEGKFVKVTAFKKKTKKVKLKA